jgi:putative DNA primase/helicase
MPSYTSPGQVQDSFRAALRAAGLDYAGPLHADGQLHRFKVPGDKERNSWFVLFAGPPAAGVFGCWKRSLKENWHNGKGDLSRAQWETVRRQWREAEAARERAEAEHHAKAQDVAAWIIRRAAPADVAHPYLVAKAVKPAGDLREYRRALALPLRDTGDTLHSLQFISPDGTKRFLTGGRISGAFFTVADKPDGPLVICEGYATGASICEATGVSTVAAMNCGNLPAVAVALRAKWPAREFVLAADNDAWTDGNPGLAKATEAAKAIGARLAVPSFPDTATRPTDFNDLARIEGRAEVRRQIEAAAAPAETDEELLSRLAALPPLEYERARKVAADKLGISRLTALDAEVATRRPKTTDGGQGFAVELPDVQPWPDPVDGAEILSAVAVRFALYVALPPGAADALALWVTHAHCYTAFIYTPRLNLCSPEKGCGKTLALDVVASLTPRALRTESITPAVLFRLVESCKPTLLLDEVDAYLNEAEELRGLLNAGHKRGARAYRCEGDSNTVRGFNAFAHAALAGIGHLPGTLHDRSIVIRLVRARPGEVLARFDSRRIETETELCRKLARWTADNFARLETADPAMPEMAFNRLADNWRVLFAVAEAAGADWPARAAASFAALTRTEDTDAQGIGATLLADIAAAFAVAEADKMPSAKLAEALAHMEGRPWPEFGKARKPITANQLANQLRKFGIGPHVIRLGTDTARGYDVADFADAFARFLPNATFPECNTVTTPANIGESPLSRVSHPENVLHPENVTKPNGSNECYTVTPCTPPTPQKEAILL